MRQFVLEPMHLIDGGVIKLFLNLCLHATQIKTGPNRLATLAKHRLKADEVSRLRMIIDVFAGLKVYSFPRKLRFVTRFCSHVGSFQINRRYEIETT